MEQADRAPSHLAEFLRSRRALVAPERAGVPQAGRRRVPGLRREEVAMLAGVSVDYYVRLEQGRERHPSPAVLDALARAFELDGDAAAHLHELAAARPAQRRAARRRRERPSPELAALLESWPCHPAMVIDRRLTVLAVNRIGRAVFPDNGVGENLVRIMFLDGDCRDRYRDWPTIAANTVAALRASVGADLDDPDLVELVGECSLHSPEFRRLWARADVRPKGTEVKHLVHPEVGDLELTVSSFTVNGTDGQQLVVYRAEPGSPSEQALALLGSLAAPATPTPAHKQS